MAVNKKKILKWIAGIIATPLLLVALVALLLYIPPVQNWCVKTVAAYASEHSGMQISVDKVRLRFPLDLGIYGVLATQPNDSLPNVCDTIADARQLTASVRMLPLFRGNVVVDKLRFNDIKVNTMQLIPDTRVKGRLHQLTLHSRGIDIANQRLALDNALIDDANIDVALADTVPPDTTSTPNHWIIDVGALRLHKTEVTLHMPGDTLQIYAKAQDMSMQGALFDLFKNSYTANRIEWSGGTLKYDNNFIKPASWGFDPNHVALSNVALRIDSLRYAGNALTMAVNKCAMKERSGLNVSSLTGNVTLDTTRITLPNLQLTTPNTKLTANVDFAFNTFAEKNPGIMRIKLGGFLGINDVKPFLTMLPYKNVSNLPNLPILVNANIDGNMASMTIGDCLLKIPGVFDVKASGKAQNLNSTNRLRADINVEAHTHQLAKIVQPILPETAEMASRLGDISAHAKLHADGTRYVAQFKATQGEGSLSGNASINTRNMAYKADIEANQLNLNNFAPGNGLQPFTGSLTAYGTGLDILSPNTNLEASAIISSFGIAGKTLSGTTITASAHKGVGHVALNSNSDILNGNIDLEALISKHKVDARLMLDLVNADLYKMGITRRPFSTSLKSDIEMKSDLNEQHSVSGMVSNIVMHDSANAYRPENIIIDAFTRHDSTYAAVTSGDLTLRLKAHGSLSHVADQLAAIATETDKQQKEKYIDQQRLRDRLPKLSLYIDAGKCNVVSRAMSRFGYNFKSLFMDMATSPAQGINGAMKLDSLVASGVRLDTIRLAFRSDSTKIGFNGDVINNKRNPQFVFNASFRGAFYKQSLFLGTRVFDDKNKLGFALGLRANMEPEGVRLTLGGIDPVIGYKKFKVNKGNYVFFANDSRITADMSLRADDGMGVRVYSPDSTDALQDITIGLTQFDLAKVLQVVPYAPNVSGMLNGDFHILNNGDGDMSISSSVDIAAMKYEGCDVGHLSSEFLYTPRDNGREHIVDGTLSLDDMEVCTISGTYNTEGKGNLDAELTLQHTPLLLLNGFIPDHLINFRGYADGHLTVKGSLDNPHANGELMFDNAYIASEPYGIEMRMCDDMVRINDSRMLLENFQLFANNNSPLTLYGYFDFLDMANMYLNIKVRANNYLLIDSKEKARSEAFGKAYVNFIGLLDGKLEAMRVRGRLDVLGKSDITYILRDSPLTTDNQLDGLVKFVDFSDKETAVVKRPQLEGLTMDIMLSIDQGAHVLCALNADQSNYVDIIGGGDLRMIYDTVDGIRISGRYTLNSGEMKYSLPVIPLKTFNIQDGSYIEFTGDVMNPRLNITATEENKATVTTDGQGGRSVTFQCGVVITKTLQDMGLQFIIDAPDDQQIHNELMTQSLENRGKTAVTMLTTGLYLADGNNSAMSLNSALSSFLNSQINAISGNALRTLDLSFGMDNTTLGSGMVHTDYSFKFSKRFWNNRLRIVIGGKVSSGAEIENQNDTFFDNVTFEYRLSENSNKYLKLFYDRDNYDWLEGYVEQFGGGFMWRRKLQHLGDIFHPKRSRLVLPPILQDTTSLKRTDANTQNINNEDNK